MDRFNEINDVAKGVSISSSKGEKAAWSDLVEKYPDKWIVFTDFEMVSDDRSFLCTVLEICDDDSKSDRKLYYISQGIKAAAMRTTSTFNGAMGG